MVCSQHCPACWQARSPYDSTTELCPAHIQQTVHILLCSLLCYYPPYVTTEDWKGIFVAGVSLTSYRYLGDDGIDRREMLHDGAYRSRTDFLTFRGGTPCPPIQNFGHMTANIAKMVSCNVTGQLELNINSMGLSKMKVMGSSHPPPGSAPPYGGFVSCWHTCFQFVKWDINSWTRYAQINFSTIHQFLLPLPIYFHKLYLTALTYN